MQIEDDNENDIKEIIKRVNALLIYIKIRPEVTDDEAAREKIFYFF